MSQLRIGVVMDPVEKINIDKDTTFVLMLEAQQRGHEIYFMELDDLFIRGGAPLAAIAALNWRAPCRIIAWLSFLRARLPISTRCSCARIRRST